MEYVGRAGVADNVQGMAGLRSILRHGHGKSSRLRVATDRVSSTVCHSHPGVLQNVRGRSQVRGS